MSAASSVMLKLFCPYQIAWINDESAMKLAEKSRRVGWTWAHAYRRVERAVKNLFHGYFSSADLTAAREFIDYCKSFAQIFNVVAKESEETAVVDDREMHTFNLTFENGRKIVAGSSNPVFFRSKGGDADADEFAFHRDGRELYKAAHATSQFWGGQFSAWSSHHGEGSYFNTLIKQAKKGELKASLHKVTIYDAVEQGIVERIIMRKKRLDDVPAADAKARQEWLDELRSTCPDQGVWEEEYECKPASDHGSLLSYESIQACEVANLQPFEDLSAIPREGPPIYAGGDIGRQKDLTVIWGDEKVGDVSWCKVLKRMQGANFSLQEAQFDLLLANPRVKRLCLDATGLGMMLGERLQGRWGKHRVELVTFTAGVKSEIAMPFVGRFQDRTCRIPMDARLRESLHSVRKMVSASGNVRLDAEHTEDGHADEFWGGALACEASDPNNVPLPAHMEEKPEVFW